MCDELNVRKGPFDRYCNWSVSGENGLGAWKLWAWKLVGNVPENTPLGKLLHRGRDWITNFLTHPKPTLVCQPQIWIQCFLNQKWYQIWSGSKPKMKPLFQTEVPVFFLCKTTRKIRKPYRKQHLKPFFRPSAEISVSAYFALNQFFSLFLHYSGERAKSMIDLARADLESSKPST